LVNARQTRLALRKYYGCAGSTYVSLFNMRNSLSNQMHCKELNLSPLGFAVCAVSYSPDGMSLAVGGTEGQCRTTLQACDAG